VRDQFVQALEELATQDRRICLITGDLGFGVLDGFASRRPAQYLNAGVAEQNMTAMATGLALEGRIVFTYSIANFPILRPLEFIRNDAAYHNANVNVVAIGGGFSYGALGISHHATEDLAILRALPGLTVVAPGCTWEVTEAVPALAATPGTTYLRLDKSSAGHTGRRGERFELGRARQLREGDDLTIASTGGILGEVLKATDQLAAEGVRCRVLSVHTIKPLDIEALSAAARETGGLMTVEEHTVDGGLGGAAAEALLELGAIPRVFRRVGLRAGFSSAVGSQDYLRRTYGLDAAAIAAEVRGVIRGCDKVGTP
jgi:transketolase